MSKRSNLRLGKINKIVTIIILMEMLRRIKISHKSKKAILKNKTQNKIKNKNIRKIHLVSKIL